MLGSAWLWRAWGYGWDAVRWWLGRGREVLPVEGAWIEIGLLDERGRELSGAGYCRQRTRVVAPRGGGLAIDTVRFPVARESWGIVREIAVFAIGASAPLARRPYRPDCERVYVGAGYRVVVMPHLQTA